MNGSEECLVIKTFGKVTGSGTLIVFIHGDGSSGGPSDYLYSLAARFSKDGVVAVGLIRPGYFDKAGQRSTGESWRREGDGYRPVVVDAVADAVKNLKAFHNAKTTILVRHSGGAAIAGVILGRFPGLADAALLAACPCNIVNWRVMRRGSNTWTRSLSPSDFTDAIPVGTRAIAVTGADDSNNFPKIAEDYIKRLTAGGVDARFELVPDAGHNQVIRTEQFFQTLEELLKQTKISKGA